MLCCCLCVMFLNQQLQDMLHRNFSPLFLLTCQYDSLLNLSWPFCDEALNGVNGLQDNNWHTTTANLPLPTGRRRSQSSNVAMCKVPRTHASLDDWSFTVAGPRLCNNLPLNSHGVRPVAEDTPVLLSTAMLSDHRFLSIWYVYLLTYRCATCVCACSWNVAACTTTPTGSSRQLGRTTTTCRWSAASLTSPTVTPNISRYSGTRRSVTSAVTCWCGVMMPWLVCQTRCQEVKIFWLLSLFDSWSLQLK